MRPTETNVYSLSNSAAVSNNGIALNGNLIGQQLVDVDLVSVAGETVSTKTFAGIPMIINIWYSTCEPCRREMPVLATTAKKFEGQVRFIGINIKDSAKVTADFAQKYGVQFEMFLDTNGQFISAAKISTAPVTLAVNEQGVITDQVAGEIDASRLEALVTELLK